MTHVLNIPVFLLLSKVVVFFFLCSSSGDANACAHRAWVLPAHKKHHSPAANKPAACHRSSGSTTETSPAAARRGSVFAESVFAESVLAESVFAQDTGCRTPLCYAHPPYRRDPAAQGEQRPSRNVAVPVFGQLPARTLPRHCFTWRHSVIGSTGGTSTAKL